MTASDPPSDLPRLMTEPAVLNVPRGVIAGLEAVA
jgi:hypothetical protein